MFIINVKPFKNCKDLRPYLIAWLNQLMFSVINTKLFSIQFEVIKKK